jgi:hypothetical protein
MDMQKRIKWRKLKMLRHAALSCLLVLGLMTIVGTGGGGGDGGGVTTGITYTGLTTRHLLMKIMPNLWRLV